MIRRLIPFRTVNCLSVHDRQQAIRCHNRPTSQHTNDDRWLEVCCTEVARGFQDCQIYPQAPPCLEAASQHRRHRRTLLASASFRLACLRSPPCLPPALYQIGSRSHVPVNLSLLSCLAWFAFLEIVRCRVQRRHQITVCPCTTFADDPWDIKNRSSGQG